MPTNIRILSPAEIKSFDLPPALNANDRKQLFRPTKSTADVITSLRSLTNKIGFILQFGYFKATNKFFKAGDFLKSEIDFVCKDFNVLLEQINFNEYDASTLERHQRITLNLLGIAPFSDQSKQLLLQEALTLCSAQMKPRMIFISLVDYLRENRIEVPVYFVISQIITTALNEHENNLLSALEMIMTRQDKHLLDDLLQGFDTKLKYLGYKLTALKKASHSLRPTRIKENIDDLLYFKRLFEQLLSITNRLNLDIRTIQYYAGLVFKLTTLQMIQRERNKYLLLVCFIIHKYYSLNDLLIDALIQSSQSALNTALKKHKEYCYAQLEQRQELMEKTFERTKEFCLTLKNIEDIVFDEKLLPEAKIQVLQSLFKKQQESASPVITINDEITKIESDYRHLKDNHYFEILEKTSIKLQNRVSEIIKHICFDQESSDKDILEAIDYYKHKNAVLGADAPTGFLNQEQQEVIFDDHKKLRVSLYKVLLFHKIASAIKSGALNLLYSYKYRAFDDYLIHKKVWEENKKSFLDRAGLNQFEDCQNILHELNRVVNNHFEETNINILNQKNIFVRFNPNNDLIVTTPPSREKELADTLVMDLFPQDRFFSLFEVLSTVNTIVPFVSCFEHWKIKGHRDRPDNKTFFAGIIGLGCNLGIRKIARISNNIKQNNLENTVNWYFSNESLNNANNMILEVIDQLSLPRVFQKDPELTHTSSDGQKFSIGVDSLNANYSFKYFGKGKGVSSYTFNDDKHRLFYTTVISPSEREAAYVIDGLMHNDVVESDIHSTDTHGYTEIVFAVTHFLGISFAPRIKDFREQRLFSIDPRVTFKDLGYIILPDEKIDTKFIEDEWDNILRFIATIKLKHTSASQLFKRLSHYSRQHPLFRAIKNFGKITKTVFLLKYIDSVELRQAIEKQLNKTESIHKFAKAVFFGSNQEFQQRTKEDQLRTDGCKRLIENVIICWNYLYLSDLIYRTSDLTERERIIKTIKNGSIVVWAHMNLQGEYNFSDDVLKNSLSFSLPKLIELEVA